MKKILLFLSVYILSQNLYSQITGGSIDYTCSGNSRYEVYVNIQVPCGGNVQLPNMKIAVGTDTLYADSVKLLGISPLPDVSSGCSTLDSCRVDSTTQRMNMYHFRGVIDLDTFSACVVRFFIEEATTNFFTTLSSRNSIYLETRTNRCLAPCNVSPVQKNLVSCLATRNKDIQDDYSVTNNDTNSSFKYSFAPCRETATQPVSYSGNFNKDRWITFYGFPNQYLQWPAGLSIDSLSGLLRFRPTVLSQRAAVCLKIQHMQQINGQDTLVGEKWIEHGYQTGAQGNNRKPFFEGSFTRIVCAGETICFDILTNDLDSIDSVFLELLDTLPGSSVVLQPGQHPSATICWTPDSSFISSKPYVLHTRIRDNGCPINLESTWNYSVHVRKKPAFTHQITQVGPCGRVDFDLTPSQNYPGLTILWSIMDSTKKVIRNGTGLHYQYNLNPGKYYLQIYLSGSDICDYSTLDSFVRTGFTYPQVTLTERFMFGCIGAQDSMGVRMAKEQYLYTWNDGNTDSLRIITLGKDTPWYALTIANGPCTYSDTFKIYPDPETDLSRSAVWIGNDSLALSILNPIPGMYYHWYLNHAPNAFSLDAYTVVRIPDSLSHFIRVHATNNSCFSEDSFVVSPAVGWKDIEPVVGLVYPNPFNDRLIINNIEIMHVALYNALGQEIAVRLEPGSERTEIIPQHDLPGGVYWLKVETEKGYFVERVSKE